MKFLFSLVIIGGYAFFMHGAEVRGNALAQRVPFVTKVEASLSKAMRLVQHKDWDELDDALATLKSDFDAIAAAEVAEVMQEEGMALPLKAWADEQRRNLSEMESKVTLHSPPKYGRKSSVIHAELNLIRKMGIFTLIPSEWQQTFFDGEDISLAKFASLPLMQQEVIYAWMYSHDENFRNTLANVYATRDEDIYSELRRLETTVSTLPSAQQRELRGLFTVDLQALMPATAVLTYEDIPQKRTPHSSEYLALRFVISAASQGFPQLVDSVRQLTAAEMRDVIARLSISNIWSPRKGTGAANRLDAAVGSDLTYAGLALFSWVSAFGINPQRVAEAVDSSINKDR